MECVSKIFLLMYCAMPVFSTENGGQLYCQQEWEKNEPVKLTFTIDKSKFPSQCYVTNNSPIFRKSDNGVMLPTRNCTVFNITTPGACSQQCASRGCCCTDMNATHYVLEYNFLAHSDYNGWWSAHLECADSSLNQKLTFSTVHCDNKVARISEPSPDTPTPAVIGGVSGAVAVVVIVLIAVVMWRYCRRKRINSKQSTTIGDNPQTTRQQQRQQRPQHISRQQDQQQDAAAAVLEGSHTASQHADIGNPYDVLQPGQDDGRTYIALKPSSTADNGTYLHPVIESRDNPSFGAYESLQSADVGQTSVYSEMIHGSGPVYGNSAIPKQ